MRGNTALRVVGDDGETVTVSPSLSEVYVWRSVHSVGEHNGLIAGPFPAEGVKSKSDLVDWYSDWIEAGRRRR